MKMLAAESCNLGSLIGDDLREGERSPKRSDSTALDLLRFYLNARFPPPKAVSSSGLITKPSIKF